MRGGRVVRRRRDLLLEPVAGGLEPLRGVAAGIRRGLRLGFRACLPSSEDVPESTQEPARH
jgi:hypothetical protein